MFSIRIVRLAALAATLAPGLTLSAQANAKGKTTVNAAVPLAMFRRMPRAAARSNASAPLVSAK